MYEEIYIGMGAGLGFMLTFVVMMLYKVVIQKMYPIRTPMMIQRGSGIVWDLGERARYHVSKTGRECLRLMKRKDTVKPPKYDFVSTDKKGKDVFPLFTTARGQHFSGKPSYKKVGIVNKPRIEIVEDKSAMNWAIQELQRKEDKYRTEESTFLKYMPFIITTILAAAIIFVVIFTMTKFEVISGAFESASSNLANAMEAFKQPQVI